MASHTAATSPLRAAPQRGDVIAGLIAYTYRDKLPSLNLRPDQIKMLKGLPSDRYVELTLYT
jgi:hypothetical protein